MLHRAAKTLTKKGKTVPEQAIQKISQLLKTRKLRGLQPANPSFGKPFQQARRALRRFRVFATKSHTHSAVVAVCFVIFAAASFFIIKQVSAATAWTQTDWSGGQGTSTVNQYSNTSNVDTGTSGQASLAQTAGWSGTYASWAKRQPVTVTNSGSAQTDYQVKLSITYDSSMNNDFSDLRFTNSSGTALNYWIESKVNGSSATVWVKVDNLAASGNTTIYMYYGNSSATSESNGNNVFLLFDDFSSPTLDSSKWTTAGAIGTLYTITGGELVLGPGNSSWSQAIYSNTAFPRSNLSFEMKYKWTSANASYDAMMMGWKDDGSGASYSNQVYAYYNSGNGSCVTSCPINMYEDGTSRGTGSGSWTENTQYETRIMMKASGGALYEQSTDGGQTWTTSYDSSYSTESNLHPSWTLYSGTHNFDDVRVRQWMTTEPTSSFGSEQSEYPSSGTLTSAIFDGSLPNDWGTLSYDATTPAGTSVSVKVRSGNQPDLSDASAWSSCSPVSSGNDATGACVADKSRYVQYQVTLATSNSAATPTFLDNTISYSASDTIPPPTNASSILMYKSNSGDSVSSNGWTNQSPYFTWTAGADDGGGSGIKGYCLYLGQDNTADPVSTKGLLGSSPLDTGGACQFAVSGTNVDFSTSGYLGTALATSNSPYYLIVKAIDNANNVYAGSAASFQFRYDNTPPSNPSFITAPSQFVSSKDVTLTWPTSGGDAAADANSGLAGLQYRIGSSGIWYGDTHNSAQDITDLLSNDGSYTTQSSPDYASLQEGNNIVYFRTWDNAGNISQAYVTTVIKLNTASPSGPQNVTATPSTNTTNSFAFSWLVPASYTGSASNITYCYTINALPSSSNCTYTSAGITSLSSGAYATQPGDNTFYVVAKDEAGNINYATAVSTTFTANTAAPGVPLNADIADISTKATSNWKLALSWETPTQTGAGVATYKVLRSTDDVSFTQIASTSGTSYVDGGLSQQTYYYKVKACDSANNCGALTSAVHDYPTGKFTSPANLLSGPSVSNISTKKATISWVTDRTSDSKVAFGTQSGTYSSDEIANSDQTVTHTINLVNLSPGTTYYFVSKWTDEDGNTGTSAQATFTTLPAPSIKDVTVTGINISTATITFTSSRADIVKLYYGTSDSFGALKTINTSQSTSTYSIQLVGLNDGTKYYFKLNTIDSDGNEYNNPQANSFTTPPSPKITNLRFQPVKDQPTSTQQITWDTNVPSTSELSYGPDGQAQQNAIDSKLTTSHSVTINALVDNTLYSLVAQSRDSAGNLAVSDKQIFHTALDTRPPKISGLKVTSSIKGTGTDAAGQIIVSWKTDEPATSQVAYGEGSDNTNYNTSTAEDRALVTDHAVVISNLSTSQIFHLQALSKDAAGNLAHSDNRTTIIGNATDSVISIIFNALQKVFGGF